MGSVNSVGAGTRNRVALANNAGGVNRVQDPPVSPEVEKKFQKLKEELEKLAQPDAKAVAEGARPPRPGQVLPQAKQDQLEKLLGDAIVSLGVENFRKLAEGPRGNSPAAEAFFNGLQKVLGDDGLKVKLGDQGSFTLKADLGNVARDPKLSVSATANWQLTKDTQLTATVKASLPSKDVFESASVGVTQKRGNTTLTGQVDFDPNGFKQASGSVTQQQGNTTLTGKVDFDANGFKQATGGVTTKQGNVTTTASATLDAKGDVTVKGGVTNKTAWGSVGVNASQNFGTNTTDVGANVKVGDSTEVSGQVKLQNGSVSTVSASFREQFLDKKLDVSAKTTFDVAKGKSTFEAETRYKPNKKVDTYVKVETGTQNGPGFKVGVVIRP
jgi:hypothetical protein